MNHLLNHLTDLSILDTVRNANEGEKVTLSHPGTGELFYNGDGSEMTVTILGPDSDKWKTTRHAIYNRRMALKKARVSGEEVDNTLLNSLVAVTVSWNITLGGEQPQCTPDKVREVYEKYPWVMKQVQAYFDDETNFSKVSVITS